MWRDKKVNMLTYVERKKGMKGKEGKEGRQRMWWRRKEGNSQVNESYMKIKSECE